MAMMLTSSYTVLRPTKVDASHSIEFLVKRSVKVSQPLQHLFIDNRMYPPLSFTQTVRTSVSLGLAQARKALGRVKVEVLLRNDPPYPEEVLDQRHLRGRIVDQSLTVNEVKLRDGEVLYPLFEVLGVQSDADRSPGRGHRARRVVEEGHLLEGPRLAALGRGLRVVGDGARDRVAYNEYQLNGPRHVVDAVRHGVGDEVARSLFNGYLVDGRRWHQRSVKKDDRYQ